MNVQNFDELAAIAKDILNADIEFDESLTKKAKLLLGNVFVYRQNGAYCFFFVDTQTEIYFDFTNSEVKKYHYRFKNNEFFHLTSSYHKELSEKCFGILKEDPKLRLLFVTGAMEMIK